jgi:hypothetical protein
MRGRGWAIKDGDGMTCCEFVFRNGGNSYIATDT